MKIVPAEAYLDRKWKLVDEFSDLETYKQALRSPTFDLFDGMFVKVVGKKLHYFGIYQNEKFYDVGPSSAIKRKYNWNYSSFSRKLTVGKSWPETWRECNEPNAMSAAMKLLFPNKLVVKYGLNLCFRVAEHEKRELTQDQRKLANYILLWLDDKMTDAQAEQICQDHASYEFDTFFHALRALLDVINVPLQFVITYLNLEDRAREHVPTHAQIADMLREVVPMRDIALHLAK